MPKIKIILVQEFYDDDYDMEIVRESLSDWEDVTDEQLAFLYKNLGYLKYRESRQYNMHPRIIVQDDVPIEKRILSIKDELKRIEAEKAAEEKKRKERKKARDKKKKLKAIEEKKQLFEQLKKELGDETAKNS